MTDTYDRPTDLRQKPGVCPECGSELKFVLCVTCNPPPGPAFRTGQQPAQPESGGVKRFKVPALYVPYPFADVADKDGLATVVLADALAAAKAYSDDLETRYHAAHERLTAAQQRVAALESELESERARGIHSCHDQCPRPLCVAHREIADLRNRLNLSEKMHGRFPVDAVQPDQKDVS